MQRRSVSLVWLGLALALLQPGCVLLPGTESNPDAGQTLPPRKAAQVNVAVAKSMVTEKRFADAIRHYEQARKLDPNLDLSPVLARLYASVGENALAREEYRKALDKHSRDADLWNDLGYFHYDLGEWPAAEKALREAVKLEPRHARAWINLGLTLGQQQKYPESLAAFEQAVPPAEAHCNLGFVLATQGKRDQAREEYQTALKLDPRQPLARAALDKLSRPSSPTATTTAKPAGEPGLLPIQSPE